MKRSIQFFFNFAILEIFILNFLNISNTDVMYNFLRKKAKLLAFKHLKNKLLAWKLT